MSLRHLKKVFDSESPLPAVNTSSEDESNEVKCEETKVQKKKTKQVVRNKFELLAASDNDNDDTVENNHQSGGSDSGECSLTANRKKQKRKRKKKPLKKDLELPTKAQNEGKSNISIDATGIPNIISSDNIVAEDDNDLLRTKKIHELFEIDPKMLNPEYELKKMFGSKVINHEKSGGRFRNSNTHRRNLLSRRGSLVYPRERAAFAAGASGITMNLLSVDTNGYKIFKFNHSSNYQDLQNLFIAAVDTLNPDTIVDLLQRHPYHIDGHIQLSDMAKHSEDMQIASELIEDGISYLQNVFDHNFDVCNPFCQVPYKYQENRSLHILIFKHLTFLGQRGCPRTALQLCKRLISLDPNNDPLAVTLMVDFYALKAGEFNWLCNLYEFWNNERNLNQLPNWAYSTALAYYMRKGEEYRDTKQTDKSNSQNRLCFEEESNKMLQYALLMFPSVLVPLLDKCGIQSDSNIVNHWYFNSSASKKQSKSLNLLCDLYVWRTHHVWRDSCIIKWLEMNTREVLRQIDADNKITNDFVQKRQRRYPKSPYNILRHVILIDSKDITIPLPQELSKKPILSFDPITPEDGVDIYDYHHQDTIHPTSGAAGNNILSMLFRSLVFDLNALGQAPAPAQAGGNQLGHVVRVENNPVPDQLPGAEGQNAPGAGLAGIQDSVTSLLHAMRDLLQTVNPVGGENEPNSSENDDDNDVD